MWFDETVVEAVVDALPLWAAVLLVCLSYLGSIYLIMPMTVLAYLRGNSWRMATWPGTVLGAYALFVALKPLTDISRPSERGVESPLVDQSLPAGFDLLHQLAVEFDTASFPSGHAVAATVFIGLVVADVDIGTRRQRLAAGVVWLTLVLVSRVGLGVHYVGDIVGGVLFGLAFLGLVFLLRGRLRTRSWQGIGPADGTLLLAAVLAVTAILVGRPVDGGLLLTAIGAGLLTHRLFKPSEIELRSLYTDTID